MLLHASNVIKPYVLHRYTSNVIIHKNYPLTPTNNQPFYDIIRDICKNSDNIYLIQIFNNMLVVESKQILKEYICDRTQDEVEEIILRYPMAIYVVDKEQITLNLINRLIEIYGRKLTYKLLSQLYFKINNVNGYKYNLIYTLFHCGPVGRKTDPIGCMHNYFKLIRLLLDIGFDVNTSNQFKVTLLMLASICNNHNAGYQLAEILLERNADTTIRNKNGYTALELAINKNNSKIIKLFEDNIKN